MKTITDDIIDSFKENKVIAKDEMIALCMGDKVQVFGRVSSIIKQGYNIKIIKEKRIIKKYILTGMSFKLMCEDIEENHPIIKKIIKLIYKFRR